MRLTEMLLPSLTMVVLLETSVHAKKTRCLKVKIENGRTYIRNSGMKAKFKCMKGYSTFGAISASCLPSGTWSSPPPLCISQGCPSVGSPPYMKITEGFNGAMLKFECTMGSNRKGPETITCNGKEWSDVIPTCEGTPTRLTQPTTATTMEPVIKQMTRKPINAKVEMSFVTKRPRTFSGKKCPKIKIKNGRMKARNHGKMAMFKCKRGYTIVGENSALCLPTGSWNHPPPICISRGCTALGPRPNIEITESYNGAMLRFACPAGSKQKGPEIITCDGRNWSARIPICEAGLTLKCDFEEGLCGWTQDVFDEFDWTRKSGKTPTQMTGPLGDHSTGGGFYMFMESSSPRKFNDVARLISPVYPPSLKNSCFDFWYHMQGPADKSALSSLEIFIKPDEASLVNIAPEFSIDGNQGSEWNRGVIQIPNQDGNFKIVIVGSRKHSFRSDIAIDDVRIFNCSEETSSSMLQNSTPMITKATDTDYINVSMMKKEEQIATEVNTDGQMNSVTTQISPDIASISKAVTPRSITESKPVTVTSRRRESTVTRLVHPTTTTAEPTKGQMNSVTTQGVYSPDITGTSKAVTPRSITESKPVTVSSRRRGSTVTRLVHPTTTTAEPTKGQMNSVTTQGVHSPDITSTSKAVTPRSITESKPVTVSSRRRGSTVTRLVHPTTTKAKPTITISKSSQKTGITKLRSVTASLLITNKPLQVTQKARTIPTTTMNNVPETSIHQKPTTGKEQTPVTMSNRINELPASPAGSRGPDSSTTELSNIAPIIISNIGDPQQSTEISSASVMPVVVGISVSVVVQMVVIGTLVWLWANRQRKKEEREAAANEICMQPAVE